MRVKQLATSELIERYAQAAQAYEDGIMRGSSKDANRQHRIAEKIFKELRARAEESELLPLLSNERPAVRLWAAVHALYFAPEVGVRVLEDLAKNAKGMAGADAILGLQLYREGKIPVRE